MNNAGEGWEFCDRNEAEQAYCPEYCNPGTLDLYYRQYHNVIQFAKRTGGWVPIYTHQFYSLSTLFRKRVDHTIPKNIDPKDWDKFCRPLYVNSGATQGTINVQRV